MGNVICYLLLATLAVLLLIAIRTTNRQRRLANQYHSQWVKWEAEYWLLRTSEAISDYYDVSLSWLPSKKPIVKKKLP